MAVVTKTFGYSPSGLGVAQSAAGGLSEEEMLTGLGGEDSATGYVDVENSTLYGGKSLFDQGVSPVEVFKARTRRFSATIKRWLNGGEVQKIEAHIDGGPILSVSPNDWIRMRTAPGDKEVALLPSREKARASLDWASMTSGLDTGSIDLSRFPEAAGRIEEGYISFLFAIPSIALFITRKCSAVWNYYNRYAQMRAGAGINREDIKISGTDDRHLQRSLQAKFESAFNAILHTAPDGSDPALKTLHDSVIAQITANRRLSSINVAINPYLDARFKIVRSPDNRFNVTLQHEKDAQEVTEGFIISALIHASVYRGILLSWPSWYARHNMDGPEARDIAVTNERVRELAEYIDQNREPVEEVPFVIRAIRVIPQRPDEEIVADLLGNISFSEPAHADITGEARGILRRALLQLLKCQDDRLNPLKRLVRDIRSVEFRYLPLAGRTRISTRGRVLEISYHSEDMLEHLFGQRGNTDLYYHIMSGLLQRSYLDPFLVTLYPKVRRVVLAEDIERLARLNGEVISVFTNLFVNSSSLTHAEQQELDGLNERYQGLSGRVSSLGSSPEADVLYPLIGDVSKLKAKLDGFRDRRDERLLKERRLRENADVMAKFDVTRRLFDRALEYLRQLRRNSEQHRAKLEFLTAIGSRATQRIAEAVKIVDDETAAGKFGDAARFINILENNLEDVIAAIRAQLAGERIKRMPRRDYYEVLGVGRDASDDEIKKAYRGLVVEHHPDRHRQDSPAVQEEHEESFKEASEAYAVLSNPEKRETYDRLAADDQ